MCDVTPSTRETLQGVVCLLTGCMLISQPVFSPGSFILSKPKRQSISSVNWLRSSRLRADIEDPSSLVQTGNINALMFSSCCLRSNLAHRYRLVHSSCSDSNSTWSDTTYWLSWSPPRSDLYLPLFCSTIFYRGLSATQWKIFNTRSDMIILGARSHLEKEFQKFVDLSPYKVTVAACFLSLARCCNSRENWAERRKQNRAQRSLS